MHKEEKVKVTVTVDEVMKFAESKNSILDIAWPYTACNFWGLGFWSTTCRKEDEYAINVLTHC